VKYLIVNIIFFLLITQSVISRDNEAPVVTCLEVHEGGEVTIYWQSLDTTALEFQIYYSTDNVNWLQAGSVDSQNQSLQFYHSFAVANVQLYYYFIKAIYTTTEVDSDVFRTIYLEVDNSTAGIATLLWNSVHTPLPEGSSNYYRIYSSTYVEGIPDSWSLIADNIENTLYNYIIPDGLCYDSINFKIEIENSYGCSSVSNITGDWFSETNQPEKPVFDSVSIINNSNVILGWESSISLDAWGTVIYRYEGNIWVGIDTVFDNNNTYYLDTTTQPCDQNFQYAIATIDSCRIVSPGSFSTPLRPIFLYNIDYDICSETNSLSWEPYINASPSLEKYEIWSSKNNGPITLIDEVAPNVEYYNHTSVDNTTEYVYFVRAVFGNYTSSSCTKSIITGNYIKPALVYLANANVLPDNNIELTIDVDLQPNSCTWEILRSDAGGGSQTILTSLSRNIISTSPIIYLDETADGSVGFYTYSINVLDSCGVLSLQSNTMKTIFLEGEQLSDIANHLSWNSFEGFDEGVDKYYIFRMLGEVAPILPIDSTDAQTDEYTDDISLVEAGESIFSYWVQAYEESENIYGYREKSNSNIISLFRETDLYFPNAFRPDGTNRIFKPVATGFGGSNYLFQIFNRWGQLIFESTDPELGWDGNYKGNSSPQGTYIYRLVYQNVYNVTKQQQGTVMLID
jgi:gliding motility-associated-like protein